MKLRSALTTVALAALASSCNVLSPVEDVSSNHVLEPAVPPRPLTGSVPALAVIRPALPGYLDRQQLVTRASGGQILMNRNHVWAEPLDAGIARVTAANLARLTGSLNIQPVQAFIAMDYSAVLELRIARFEPDDSGDMVLDCTWKLQPVTGRLANTRSFQTRVPIRAWAVSGAESASVAAMNEALARLAREVARGL